MKKKNHYKPRPQINPIYELLFEMVMDPKKYQINNRDGVFGGYVFSMDQLENHYLKYLSKKYPTYPPLSNKDVRTILKELDVYHKKGVLFSDFPNHSGFFISKKEILIFKKNLRNIIYPPEPKPEPEPEPELEPEIKLEIKKLEIGDTIFEHGKHTGKCYKEVRESFPSYFLYLVGQPVGSVYEYLDFINYCMTKFTS